MRGDTPRSLSLQGRMGTTGREHREASSRPLHNHTQPGALDKPINNHHPIYSLDRADSHLPRLARLSKWSCLSRTRFPLCRRECGGEGGSWWKGIPCHHSYRSRPLHRVCALVCYNQSLHLVQLLPPCEASFPHSFISPLFHSTPLKLLSLSLQ